MAVTSMWSIKGRADKVLNYVINPEKTTAENIKILSEYHAIDNVLEYAVDDLKTEKKMYVSGINCDAEYANQQFKHSKDRWEKKGKIVAFHGYQSFKENEVTARQAHNIGVELAKRLWGENFEVVVATHLNTGHYHNHFVLNSVSFNTGKRYLGNLHTYMKMREESDKLCREYGLSVIEETSGKSKNYAEWQAEKTGKLTKRDTIRRDIDTAIKASVTQQQFIRTMEVMGYEFKLFTSDGNRLKYPSIKPPGAKGFFRFHRLGEEYDLPRIVQRIRNNNIREEPFPDLYKQKTYTESCEVFNLPRKPKVLSETDYSKIIVRTPNSLTIKSEIELLENEYTKLKELKPRVLDNFEELNTELSKVQSEIIEFEKYLENIRKKEVNYSEIIKRLNADLELLILDIRNNNDAARLKKLGSDDRGINTLVGICPVCNQPINDSLIDANAINEFMSIEDNIRHLKEQKKMIEFTIESRKESRNRLRREKEDIERRLQGLRRLAHTLRSDIYMSTNTDDSEAIMLKRIEITKRIERLSQLENDFDELIDKLKDLSVEWNIYIEQKSKLPSKGISDSDTEKIALLKKYFIANLKQYNYSSLSSVEGIDISIDSSLLPTIDGFDMKFDSSASDGIRVIWAFTIALLQTSIEKNGNHPGVIIFDEPAQQSIVSEDMKSFIESAVKIKKPFQIITAITLNSQELIEIIDELDNSSYHKIAINGKAFRKFN